MFKFQSFFFASILLLSACATQPQSEVRRPQSEAAATVKLDDAVGKNGGSFETYYKFIVPVTNGNLGQLVYQNLDLFDLHQQYLATLAEYKGMTGRQIDAVTFDSTPVRKAYTGVFVKRAGDDGIFRSRFSLAMKEVPTPTLIAQIGALIKKSASKDFGFGTAFDFELAPSQVTGFTPFIGELKSKGFALYSSRLNVMSLSYTDGWSIGTLVIAQDQDDLDRKVAAGQVKSDSLILAIGALREIPKVAGVISAVALTPASHTVLLAQMYGLPVAYFKDAVKIFSAAAGQPVFLYAHSDPQVPLLDRKAEYLLNPNPADVQLLSEMKTKPALSLQFNPANLEIKDAKTLQRQQDVGSYGGKASQMGTLLRQLPANSVRAALAIPLGFSVRFINSSKASTGQTLRDFINDRMNQLKGIDVADPAWGKLTDEIQTEIVKAKFPDEDLKVIETRVRGLFTDVNEKLRFRSSSNVEDGPEFNGAGLYDSTGFWLGGPKADNFEKKLKKVIASLYNKRAVLARREFSVDENSVGMGILVHPAFIGEAANILVRYTRPPANDRFAPQASYEFVSLLGDEENVTHANSVQKAEVVSGYSDRITVQQPYGGNSMQKTLFPEKFYLSIGAAMEKVASEYGSSKVKIDIESEVKVVDTPKGQNFIIKQVRPVPKRQSAKTRDGSRYVVLGGKDISLFASNYNNDNAFADMWLPKKIVLSLDTFTEAQMQAGQIHVVLAEFEIQGQKVSLQNPRATVTKSEGNGVHIKIALPTAQFPGLGLSLERSDIENLSPAQSVFTPGVYYSLTLDNYDVKMMQSLGLGDSVTSVFESAQSGYIDLGLCTSGGFSIGGGTAAAPVTVTSDQAFFSGEGDDRSIRMKRATVTGVWKRALNIPVSGIGYGANHHQGDEAFAFNLLLDPSLAADEKKQIQDSLGSYLYVAAQRDNDSKPQIYAVKESGVLKKFGSWKSQEKLSGAPAACQR